MARHTDRNRRSLREKRRARAQSSPSSLLSTSPTGAPSPQVPVSTPGFPSTRMRRNRRTSWSRDLVRETELTPANLIWPIFVIDGENKKQNIKTMPGVQRLSVDHIGKAAKDAEKLGIPAIALFPNTPDDARTDDGREAWNPDNLVCRAVQAAKDAAPDVGVICDVALDPYTSHGHDGLMEDGEILNDPTIEALIRQTLNQVEAGCDVIAPSDMMDGRIGAIRAALENTGNTQTQILAYSAKYASAFYGPFRDAVGSSGTLTGDKRTYQMDPANSDEAVREAQLDLDEGADMIMVKPGLPYLDIVRRLKSELGAPTVAYHTSGEYAMVRAAGAAGMVDDDKILMECLWSFRRAGADAVLTYFAKDAAKTLNR